MASASELVSKANELFVEEDYQGALDLYSKAIALDPQASSHSPHTHTLLVRAGAT